MTLTADALASPMAYLAACRHASIQTTMVYAHNLDRAANGAERFVKI